MTLILAFAYAMIISFTALSATWIDPDTGIKWSYTVSNGKASIYKRDSTAAIQRATVGAITIPSSLDGYQVMAIGECAFYCCAALTSVTIPSSVTSIGKEAFAHCEALTSVRIPSSVTNIGNSAFCNCYALTNVTIPSSVRKIGHSAFFWCSALMNVTMSDGLMNIGGGAFQNCRELTSVSIPSSVKEIGSNAFLYCNGLRSVTIPACVTRMADVFPDYLYSSITNVVICDGVTNIGEHLFMRCSALTSVTIPSSVTSIGNAAFCACTNLTSITIPSSVTNIHHSAFQSCSGMKSFLVDVHNPSYESVNGLLLTKGGQLLVAGINGDVTIPSTVTNIGANAFCGYSGLTSVTIPNSVASIGEYAFAGCSGLTNMAIPSSMTVIGYWVFQGCSGLTSVTIPSSVTNIAYYAFDYCKALTTVYVDAGDVERVKGLFLESNCHPSHDGDLHVDTLTFIAVDRIPDLGENPTQAQIADALSRAADAGLGKNITTPEKYTSFRDWAGKVKGSGGVVLGSSEVMSAKNVWLSYALGSATLIEKMPTADDIAVESFTSTSESGKFDFTVSVKGVTVGSDALKENLKLVFGLEGATSLDANDFSASNVDIAFGTPENGKVKFTAGPNARNASSATFFMKVRITP